MPTIFPGVCVRPFVESDQAAARRLILAGLGEHFGWIDESLNLDLNDILASYVTSGHVFVVAEQGGEVVGTGALIEEEPVVGRLVRVSVGSRHRRQGIGRGLVEHLVAAARERGYRRLLVETNDDWDDAIGLYLDCGFVEVEQPVGHRHLALEVG